MSIYIKGLNSIVAKHIETLKRYLSNGNVAKRSTVHLYYDILDTIKEGAEIEKLSNESLSMLSEFGDYLRKSGKTDHPMDPVFGTIEVAEWQDVQSENYRCLTSQQQLIEIRQKLNAAFTSRLQLN